MSDTTQRPVRVRIAPSPTGDPHVGTAYIGQINEIFARQRGGAFILRIEDTDQVRSAPVYEQKILESLAWFGLRWDEGPDVGGPHGPYRQSERRAIYAEYAEILLERGGAYYSFSSPDRNAAERKEAWAAGQQVTYDAADRDLPLSEARARVAAGEPYVIRLKMPTEGETIVQDRLRGPIAFQSELVNDPVLVKGDGWPTYHFANVVDDHLMGITHVIRAEEWINSTPKHLILYQAFGWEAPEFIHMPLLRNQDKSKISKRKNPTSLIWYQQAGFLPEALRNFLGLMGWTPPSGQEKFSPEEMRAAFDIDRMSLGGPIFDLTKLKWLNGLYIREMEQRELQARVQALVLDPAYIGRILPLVQPRMETLDDFFEVADFFFRADVSLPTERRAELVPKNRTPADTRTMLAGLIDKLEADASRSWTAAAIEAAMRAHGEAIGWKTKDLFMTTRLVVTGKSATPPLCESMEVLGKERVRWRFQKAMDHLKALE